MSHTDYKIPDLGRSLHHAKAINYLEHCLMVITYCNSVYDITGELHDCVDLSSSCYMF